MKNQLKLIIGAVLAVLGGGLIYEARTNYDIFDMDSSRNLQLLGIVILILGAIFLISCWYQNRFTQDKTSLHRKQCPSCGLAIADDVKVCPRCGSEIDTKGRV